MVATRDPEFSHVFVKAIDPRTGERRALDPTVARSYPGWTPERVIRRKTFTPRLGRYTSPRIARLGDASWGQTFQQVVANVQLQPVVNAVGSRIAYGQRISPVELDLGGGAQGNTALAWFALGSIALIGVAVATSGGRRR